MRIISSILILFLLSFQAFAHEGGHYHRGYGTVFNSWSLLNGQQIKGNFANGNREFILLEQEEGKMLRISVSSLSMQDQKLALFKVRKLEAINRDHFGPQIIPVRDKAQYRPIDLVALSITLLALLMLLLVLFPVKPLGMVFQLPRSSLAVWSVVLVAGIFACKKSTDPVNPVITTIPRTSIGFLDSAFAPYRPGVSTSSDATYYHVNAGGMPAHNMMVGIISWQQQVPIPQNYTGSNSWSIPFQPSYADVPLSTKTNLMKGAVAIAVNGIPIFNALNNRGVDSYATGELDNWGGHCGRADDYHYHAAPLHLAGTSGNLPIAFALDGFAVYGSNEPDGSSMRALDTCHGHVVNTGVYHYHGTSTYPYVVGAMRGKVTLDPSTPAPENQILPQAFASPLRPALTPLNGAVITAFESTGVNAYKLTYQRGNKQGYVEYNWDANNRYTYKLTDTSGAITINTYQR